MANLALSDFLAGVLPDLPGCPTAVATTAALRTLQDFCKETYAWSEVQDPIALQDDLNEIDLDAPSGARCIAIMSMFCGNREVHPRTLAQIQADLPDWQTCASNLPLYYTQAYDYTSARIFPIPTGITSEQLTIRAAYMPTDAATTIDEDLAARFRETLEAGTKHRLMRAANQPWTDLKLAKFYGDLYDDGVISARILVKHDKTPGSVYVPARSFGFR